MNQTEPCFARFLVVNYAELRVEAQPLFVGFEVFVEKFEFSEVHSELVLGEIASCRCHKKWLESLLYLAARHKVDVEG